MASSAGAEKSGVPMKTSLSAIEGNPELERRLAAGLFLEPLHYHVPL